MVSVEIVVGKKRRSRSMSVQREVTERWSRFISEYKKVFLYVLPIYFGVFLVLGVVSGDVLEMLQMGIGLLFISSPFGFLFLVLFSLIAFRKSYRPTRRDCPYCDKSISSKATVCPYCQRVLDRQGGSPKAPI